MAKYTLQQRARIPFSSLPWRIHHKSLVTQIRKVKCTDKIAMNMTILIRPTLATSKLLIEVVYENHSSWTPGIGSLSSPNVGRILRNIRAKRNWLVRVRRPLWEVKEANMGTRRLTKIRGQSISRYCVAVGWRDPNPKLEPEAVATELRKSRLWALFAKRSAQWVYSFIAPTGFQISTIPFILNSSISRSRLINFWPYFKTELPEIHRYRCVTGMYSKEQVFPEFSLHIDALNN